MTNKIILKPKNIQNRYDEIAKYDSVQRIDFSVNRPFISRWDPRFNRPKVLIDMDDCINNFLSYLCKVYNQRTGEHIIPSQIKDWSIEKYMGQEGIDIIKEEGFFYDVPEKRRSVSTLKDLIESTKYDVYIITACGSTRELQEKIDWFDRFLPTFNKDKIIKCQEKEIIRGSVLIDDKYDNLKACEPFMHCIIFDMPHNREHQEYPRIKSLSEAVPIIDNWFYPER